MPFALKKHVDGAFITVLIFDDDDITSRIGKAKAEDPAGSFVVEKIHTTAPASPVDTAPKRRRKGAN